MKINGLLVTMFVDQDTVLYRQAGNFFALLTIISIVSLVLETVPSLVEYHPLFIFIEWVVVVLFTLEYCGRLIAARPWHSYSLSFFGIIDLAAILPTFLGLGNFTFLKSARAVRIIRLLRMARLAKVSRTGLVSEESVGVLTFNVLIYFTTLLTALLLTGTIMYLAEPHLTAFESIPAGMWWSLKVIMSGIPVATPETTIGEVFFVLTRFIGLLLLGLLIGVIGNMFRTVLLGKREGTLN